MVPDCFDAAQIEARFEHQLMVMATAPSPQLSPVLGACTEDFCIVYEYAPGASLDQRLAGSNGEEPLSWKERIKLAYGAPSPPPPPDLA